MPHERMLPASRDRVTQSDADLLRLADRLRREAALLLRDITGDNLTDLHEVPYVSHTGTCRARTGHASNAIYRALCYVLLLYRRGELHKARRISAAIDALIDELGADDGTPLHAIILREAEADAAEDVARDHALSDETRLSLLADALEREIGEKQTTLARVRRRLHRLERAA